MALQDLFSNIHLLVRWLHVVAGITWIGMLYFFNFVNVPLQGALDDATKKAVNPQMMPRALWWFRWGAMVTFLAGLVLYTMIYMYTPGVGFGPTSMLLDGGHMTARSTWIHLGMFFGTLMWFNVWFIIWPTQRKILGGKAKAEELPALRKKALMFSRMNSYMSGPMLFGMLAPSHYGASNALTLAVAVILGSVAIWWAIKAAPSVGKTV